MESKIAIFHIIYHSNDVVIIKGKFFLSKKYFLKKFFISFSNIDIKKFSQKIIITN